MLLAEATMRRRQQPRRPATSSRTATKTPRAKPSQNAGPRDTRPYAQRMYETTENPVYVWEALGTALAAQPHYGPNASCYNLSPIEVAQIPAWIGHYLVRVARAVHQLSRPGVDSELVVDHMTKSQKFVHRHRSIPSGKGGKGK